MQENVKCPVGRLVWGNPGKPTIKKHQDGALKGQPVMKDGKQVEQFACGIAFPKAEFQAGVWPFMEAEAKTGYPNGIPSRFAWKWKDGDGVDSNGKPYSDREGYAGCYVLTISTEAFAPPIYKLNAAGNGYDQMTADMIKLGDYFAPVINLKVNVPAVASNTPSLYVNPVLFEFVAYGQEIISVGAVDPMAVLAGQRHALPPGASATPLQTQTSVAPPGMGAPPAMPGAAAPGMPGAPAAMPGAAPGMPGQPAAAPMGMAPAGTPPAPGMAAAPPPPPAPVASPPAMQRPTDPTHIHAPGTPGEMWWNGSTWVVPPAQDFVANAGAPQMPGMMPPR